jgi:zinc protease
MRSSSSSWLARSPRLLRALVAAALLTTTRVHAEAPPHVHLEIEKATLPNGLRVVMQVDHTSPTIAVDVMYDVGSRNEQKGHTGFAHLFEHMMFQGSANVARGQHFTLISAHGGTMNGTTNMDRTNYFEMLPQSELELALWLEADRMKSLDISAANFENQRKVVEEEYRMRYENAAYVPASLRRDELMFQGYFPYEHSTIGSMADLDAAKLEWVRTFHDEYYGPNNAVLAITGDFDPAQAMTWVTKHFGPAKSIAHIPPFEPPPLPPQTAPRAATVDDPHAKLPAILDGWVIPTVRTADHYALEVASAILGDGESSRLNEQLVRKTGLCVSVDAGTDDRRGPPDALTITARLSSGASVEKVEAILDENLTRLAAKGPDAAELTKVKNRIEAGEILGLQTNFARAQQIAEHELFFGDANLINSDVDHYLAVTAADVSRVVARYLTPEHRTRVLVKPAGGAP